MPKKTILCLGNNTKDTDNRATQLAELNDSVNFGLVSQENLNEQRVPGVYHTTIVDCSYQDIQRIIKEIDLLYVFDQTYDDKAVKHRTLEIAEMLSTEVEVQYENADNTSNYNYWSELVKDNKSFCIYPFIELMTQNGKTSVCCRSNVPVEDVENIIDWQTNEKYQHIRNKMIKGEKLHHCALCYKSEELGVASSRQLDTTMWAERLNLTSVEQLATINTPAYYEIRASNVCNLQCRTCGPQWSNQLDKEWKEIGLTSKDTTYGYTGFDIVKFDQLDINLKVLQNRTIKLPKVQETSTLKLIRCSQINLFDNSNCSSNFTIEILPTINRRLVLPLFLPALALICSLLLIKNKNSILLSNISIFAYSFLLLLFAELVIRYTGINKILNYIFILTPLLSSVISYYFLRYKFSNESY